MTTTPAAQITTFKTEDFRKVGVTAEVNPEWLDAKKHAYLIGVAVRVVKVNPKTVVIETEVGRNVTVDPYMLVPTDRTFTPIDPADRIMLGSVVTLRGKSETYVVISAKGGTFNVAVMGGDDDKYYRNVRPSQMTVVRETTFHL